MKTWYLYAILTILTWGVWGVFSKFASAHSKPRQILIFQSVGVLAFALVVLCVERFHIEWSTPGFTWSVAAGFFTFIGFLTFFAALEHGKASTVVTLSALYPVVTILLSVIFLRERISLKEGAGIVFALIASVLLAS